MKFNKWIWLILRLLIIAYFFYGGLEMYSPDIEEIETSFDGFDYPLIISAFPVLFFPPMIIFFSWRDYRNHPEKRLSKPNWFSNFINFKESFHFFEVGGYSFIACGLGLLLSSYIAKNLTLFGPIFFISGGIGVLLGVYISVFLYAKDKNKS